MNFGYLVQLVLEDERKELLPITDADMKDISNSYQNNPIRVDNFTVKVERSTPKNRYHNGRDDEDDEFEVTQTTTITHLKNGLWRSEMVDTKAEHDGIWHSIEYQLDMKFNPDPEHCNFHNPDGPAIIYNNYGKYYYYNGKEIPKDYVEKCGSVKAAAEILGMLDI